LRKNNIDPAIENAVRKILAEISKNYTVIQAVIYGSIARGNAHSDSDVDLAIFLPGSRGNFMDVLLDMSDTACDVLLETGVLIEPLPIWIEEWEHPEKYPNPALLRNIKEEGVCLWAQTN